MNKERLESLKFYIKQNISSLLIRDFNLELISNYVILNSNVSNEELNGHYEKVEFCPPNWYKDLLEKK